MNGDKISPRSGQRADHALLANETMSSVWDDGKGVVDIFFG